MNKDAILATLIGFAIGLTITGIIIVAPTLAKSVPKITLPTIPLPHIQIPWIGSSNTTEKGKSTTPGTKVPVTPATAEFSIDAPIDEAIETAQTALVSGKAAKGSRVVIMGELDDAVVVSENGTYAGSVSLKEGINEITVTQFTGPDSETKMLTIYRSVE